MCIYEFYTHKRICILYVPIYILHTHVCVYINIHIYNVKLGDWRRVESKAHLCLQYTLSANLGACFFPHIAKGTRVTK